MAVEPKIDFMFFSDSASYFIVDEISGCQLLEDEFASAEAAQAYLEAHRDELIRRGPPALDPAESELYGRAIEAFERRLGNGEIDAGEAARIVKHLARIASRCPGEAFRQRLVAVLERLRTL
jgi:hypothetical protein